MVKKLLFAALLLSLQVNPWSVFAISGPKGVIIPTDACTAPPPDSIRVTTIGYNYVTVAWDPTPLVQNYRLTVYKKNPSNNWDSLYSVNLVNTTTYTIDDLEPQEEYMAGIRSVCQNGEQGGTESFSSPIHGVIIELTLEGRRPINPVAVNCDHIDYLDPINKWVGFSFSNYTNHGTITTFFEFEKIDIDSILADARIKRVDDNSNLVTANQNNYWPTLALPEVEAYFMFNVGEHNGHGFFEDFGDVLLTLNEFPTSVNLCALLTSNSYGFQTLVAKDFERCKTCPGIEPGSGIPGSSGNGGGQGNIYSDLIIKVENPFSEYLKVFASDYRFNEEVFIYLLTVRGDLIFEERVHITGSEILIPTSYIEPGIYILHIEGNGFNENIKTIKIE